MMSKFSISQKFDGTSQWEPIFFLLHAFDLKKEEEENEKLINRATRNMIFQFG